MPWKIVRNSNQCPSSKPFGVAKEDGGEVVGCHETEEAAKRQLAALYASENRMDETHTFLVEASTLEFQEVNGVEGSWVHALPLGTYKHPVHGPISITTDRARRFVESVKNKVRGIDPSINYYHENNDDAAGWVKDAKQENSGVWLFVEWTKDAVEKIKQKKIRYFSSEFADEWTDPEGRKFKDVIFGGALTNRPFMKNLVPVNLSESTISNSFELVAAIKGVDTEALKGGNESMEFSEDQLATIATKVAEQLAGKLPKVEDPKVEDPIDLSEIQELKQLAEDNPLVAALIRQVEQTGASAVETQKKLQEERIQFKLAEFDNSKLVLTPVAKKQVYELLTGMPIELHEKFWDLMGNLKKSQTFLVELGERAGANITLGGVGESAAKRFQEETNKLVATGVSYPDAVERVAATNPKLYDEYRDESFINS